MTGGGIRGSRSASPPRRRLKRGFSHFKQEPDAPFVPRPDHGNELLVAASPDDARGDTHWLRADVDAFFAAEARRAGVPFFEDAAVTLVRDGGGWRISGTGPDGSTEVVAAFVIDATGEAGIVARAAGVPEASRPLLTRSRAIFGHFENVRPWAELLPAGAGSDHPFPCDRAALHHLIDEGWMWHLRFDSGVVSAGFALDVGERPLDPAITAEAEWDALLSRYPSIASQFAEARLVAPAGGLRRTGRMQRLAANAAGEGWASLPNAAGFVDPLHSTGIAQTLCGVERLAAILKEHWRRSTLPNALRGYDRTLRREFRLIDRLVSGGCRARRDVRTFAAWAMLYFAAATTCERRRLRGELPTEAAFLCADDPAFVNVVRSLSQDLAQLTANGRIAPVAAAAFERSVADAIRPFNTAGLCDPAACNMYRHTALPADA